MLCSSLVMFAVLVVRVLLFLVHLLCGRPSRVALNLSLPLHSLVFL